MMALVRSYTRNTAQTRLIIIIGAAVVLNGMYCLAYRYASGNPATLFEAFSWGAINFAPWIAAIELGRSMKRLAHLFLLFIAAALLSLLLEALVDLRTPAIFDLVRRLPGAIAAMAVLGMLALIQRQTGGQVLSGRADVADVKCEWASSAGNYVELHGRGDRTELVRSSLSQVTEEAGSKLIRIHRRYAVRSKSIRRIERTHVLLSDGTRLPIGDRYRDQLPQ